MTSWICTDCATTNEFDAEQCPNCGCDMLGAKPENSLKRDRELNRLLSKPKEELSPNDLADIGESGTSGISDEEKLTKEGTPEPSDERITWFFTAIQLSNAMLGSGVLAFPKALARVGVVMFACAIVLFPGAVFFTSVMLIDSGKRRDIMDLSALTHDTLGPRTAIWLRRSIIMSSMGAMFSYLNVIGSLGSEVLRAWGFSGPESTYAGCMILWAIAIIPLIMFRSFGELAPVAIGSLVMIIFVLAFVGFEGRAESQTGDFLLPPLGWHSSAAGAQTLGTFAYAATIQTATLEAYRTTRKEDKPVFVSKALVLSILLGATVLSLMAVLGYAAFGEDCASDILSNFDAEKGVVQFALLVVVVHLALYIPGCFVILRLFAMQSFGVRVADMPSGRFVAATLGLYAVPVLIMASVPEDDVAGVFAYIIEITGSMPTCYCCFIVPSAIYIASFRDEKTSLWYLATATLAIGCFVFVVVPVVSTMKFISACGSPRGCKSY